MLVILGICVLLQEMFFCTCWSPKIVGGDYPNITEFPHVASLKFTCKTEYAEEYYACGSSIINQEFLLTAAHCMHECSVDSHIIVTVGHCNNRKGKKHTGHSFLVHEEYDPGLLANDIAIVKLRVPITFSKTVARVALMQSPPYLERAHVAGWGLISEIDKLCGDNLKFVEQYVWEDQDCKRLIKHLPKGALCASSRDTQEYASIGDSGSALVARGYIQIGIVSYKKPSVSRNLIVYTDTGYFFSWIKDSVEDVYCTFKEGDDERF